MATQTGTWSSSDTSVATVDENGVVTGVKEGSVTITFTTDDGSSSSYDITVSNASTPGDDTPGGDTPGGDEDNNPGCGSSLTGSLGLACVIAFLAAGALIAVAKKRSN